VSGSWQLVGARNRYAESLSSLREKYQARKESPLCEKLKSLKG